MSGLAHLAGAAGLGGVLAALALGWGHAKSAYARASGLLVARADASEGLATVAATHLFRSWSRLPGSSASYEAMRRELEGRGGKWYVPYRVHRVQGVNWRGGRVVVASWKADRLYLAALRGAFDFERFFREAIEEQDALDLAASANQGLGALGFSLADVVGEDASSLRHLAGGQEVAGHSPTPGWSGTFLDQLEAGLSVSLRGSFMYPRSAYERGARDAFAGLALSPEVMAHVEQAREWARQKDFYQSRRIPWARGWALYGEPGGGKSSLVRALAEDLGVPLYRFHLATLSDQELLREWRGMARPCVALAEDVDAVYHGRAQVSKGKAPNFDTLLNCVSGVESKEGVFFVITANDISKVDPALGAPAGGGGASSRPGRTDAVIHLGALAEDQRRRMAEVTLSDWPELVGDAVGRGEGMVAARFQELLVRLALGRLREGREGAAARREAAGPRAGWAGPDAGEI